VVECSLCVDSFRISSAYFRYQLLQHTCRRFASRGGIWARRYQVLLFSSARRIRP
jgi:hypothetical protein